MDEAMKDAIVNKHNELRNKTAWGEVPGYDQAAKMATIQWDDDLEEKARLNVYQCKMDHDDCGSKISKTSIAFMCLAECKLIDLIKIQYYHFGI